VSAAAEDQTVRQDILAMNRDVPEKFIRAIEKEIIYNDSRSVKVEAVQTGVDFSLADRGQLRKYLHSLVPEEMKALKFSNPDQYLAVLKDMVSELFPEGAKLRFRTENGVYGYEHLLKDVTRREYIITLPKTLKDADVTVEFTTLDGAQKAYLIRKYFDPDIQKDIWDMLVIRSGELQTKFVTRGRKGESSIEGKILAAGNEASRSATPPGNTGSAPTPEQSTGINITDQSPDVKSEVKPGILQNRGSAGGSVSKLNCPKSGCFSEPATLPRRRVVRPPERSSDPQPPGCRYPLLLLPEQCPKNPRIRHPSVQ
jgi:hypothetical protein